MKFMHGPETFSDLGKLLRKQDVMLTGRKQVL